MNNELEIVVVNTADEAKAYVKKGYTPVECSFGNESVIDDLRLDHHGSMSGEESVAIRAYRDLFGSRADSKKIVVNHIDADNMFAFIQSKKDYKIKFQEKFGESMTKEELVAWIEENGIEQELDERVNRKWEDFEDSIRSNRKKKYYAKQPQSEE